MTKDQMENTLRRHKNNARDRAEKYLEMAKRFTNKEAKLLAMRGYHSNMIDAK
jgi:hypothetical protein